MTVNADCARRSSCTTSASAARCPPLGVKAALGTGVLDNARGDSMAPSAGGVPIAPALGVHLPCSDEGVGFASVTDAAEVAALCLSRFRAELRALGWALDIPFSYADAISMRAALAGDGVPSTASMAVSSSSSPPAGASVSSRERLIEPSPESAMPQVLDDADVDLDAEAGIGVRPLLRWSSA